MSWLIHFSKSTLGAKFLMAISGFALAAFVFFHMAGNLQLFLGPDAINAYGDFLQSKPALVWSARLGLLVLVAAHIFAAIRLTSRNRAARPVAYAAKHTFVASLASRSMIYSGLMLLAFIVYHLAHFTVGSTHPEHHALMDAQGRHDIYSMVVLGFQIPWVSGVYIFAMLLLGGHLSHGVSSMFQSLGWHHPRYNPWIKKIGPAYALLIVVGNCALPIAVLTGMIALPAGGTF